MNKIWSFKAEGPIGVKRPLHVEGGFVYVFDGEGCVAQLDKHTGKLNLRRQLEDRGYHLFFLDHSAYILYTRKMILQKLRLSDLNILADAYPSSGARFVYSWSVSHQSGVVLGEVPEKCYENCPLSLTCYDADLNEQWRRRAERPGSLLCAVDEEVFLESCVAYTLELRSAANGSLVAELDPLPDAVKGAGAYDDYVYVWTSGALWVHRRSDQSVGPVRELGVSTSALSFADDATMYISSRGGVVGCSLDAGEVFQRFDCKITGDSNVQDACCLVGDVICFGSNNGFLWCYNRLTGELIEKLEYHDFVSTKPVLDGRRLYVASFDGTVECFDVSSWLPGG